MKVYIQSKSGDYNTESEFYSFTKLSSVMDHLRKVGGYSTELIRRNYKEIFVPFEEIEFIAKVEEN